jgi:DNA-binding NarL/FixJ family response regulator
LTIPRSVGSIPVGVGDRALSPWSGFVDRGPQSIRAVAVSRREEALTASIRVLVIGGHRMLSDALEVLLAQDGAIEMVGSVGTLEEGLDVCSLREPDVVVLDTDTSGDGALATRRLRRAAPRVRVLVISEGWNGDQIARLLEAGGSGYLPKTDAGSALAPAIRRVRAGEVVIPSDGMADTVSVLVGSRAARAREDLLLGRLTGRELDVLQSIVRGESTTQIAVSLGISPLTVRTHVRNVLAKLGVHSRLEAMALAARSNGDMPEAPLRPRSAIRRMGGSRARAD